MEQIASLTEATSKLASTFEEFKKANDARIAEIEKKGSADILTTERVDKINAEITRIEGEIKARVDEIEKKSQRPRHIQDADESKAADEFNIFVSVEDRLKNRRVKSVDIEGYRAYKSAFVKSLRYGVNGLDADEIKALSVGSDPDGGYWVTPDLGGQVVKKVFETSEMRPISSVQAISTDALEGVNDNNDANAGWVAETGARTATASPQIGKWRIPVFEMYAMPEATQQLLDDSMVDAEAWLAAKVADKLSRLENTAFVTGNGVTQPRGFASYTTSATADATRAWGVMEHVATGTSGGFGTAPNGSDKLIDLVHKLKSAYRQGARFAMNRGTVGAVRQLKANGEYIWLPSMVAGQPSSLLGYPVSELEDMAPIAANSLSIAFGNFTVGYQIVDRQGVRVLRDPFTNKPYVRFYTTKRVGGDVLNFEAIKFMKFI